MKKINPLFYQLGPTYKPKELEENKKQEDPRKIKPIQSLEKPTPLRDPKQKTSSELTKLLNLPRR